jgi:predicted RNase H-like nuclease
MAERTAVLGMDAAWTGNRPSGVALIRRDRDARRFVAAEASYQTFLLKAEQSEPCANSNDTATLIFEGFSDSVPQVVPSGEQERKFGN